MSGAPGGGRPGQRQLPRFKVTYKQPGAETYYIDIVRLDVPDPVAAGQAFLAQHPGLSLVAVERLPMQPPGGVLPPAPQAPGSGSDA
jgi:hypothetical protein